MPQAYSKVEQSNVCWAVSGNPMKIDIGKHSPPEALMIARLERVRQIGDLSIVDIPRPVPEPVFNIASEEGFGEVSTGKKPRVYLRVKRYNVVLTVGGDDIEPIEERFELFEADGIIAIQRLAG